MAVLVVLLGVVVALLALLVAGLLRNHAEILRALHQLGVDLDPARADGIDTPVGAPTLRSGTEPAVRSGTEPAVRSATVPRRAARGAADVVGTGPDEAVVSVAVSGVSHLTLLAFLSSGCGTCHVFWDAFGEPQLAVPGDARLVIVTKDAHAESIAMIRKLSPGTVPVVMSSSAWEAYDVPVAPFFALVDGGSGSVVGEGAAANWDQVTSLLRNALDDAGLLDRKGRVKSGVKPRARADDVREARVDRDLLAAGITPGDPSLYALPEQGPVERGPVAHEPRAEDRDVG